MTVVDDNNNNNNTKTKRRHEAGRQSSREAVKPGGSDQRVKSRSNKKGKEETKIVSKFVEQKSQNREAVESYTFIFCYFC